MYTAIPFGNSHDWPYHIASEGCGRVSTNGEEQNQGRKQNQGGKSSQLT